MATTTVKETELVNSEKISFIRPQRVSISVADARPNTRLYPFFDGERIDSLIRPAPPILPDEPIGWTTGGVYMPPPIPTDPFGAPLVTDAHGRLEAQLSIPPETFLTGDHEIMFTDVENLDYLDITNNVFGSARAIFRANGSRETYQTTITNTTVVVVPPPVIPPPRTTDPLAQSFFVSFPGGVFLTSIDLYFFSKDNTIPVVLEIRPLVNGYPGPLDTTNPDFTIVKPSSEINISDDASVATNFKFKVPLFLPEGSEYCFVLMCNTTKYSVWTSRLGERSLETGRIIHEQPYVGSLFKSENNSTWTAEQYEDIKFTLYKASFKTTLDSTATLKATNPIYVTKESVCETTNSSNYVLMRCPKMHGLTVGSRIYLTGDDGASYNGIPYNHFLGERIVTKLIDDFCFEFGAGADATSSGLVTSCNIVREINVTNGGSNYTSIPTVSIGAPDVAGTQATAIAEIVLGKVSRIVVTNPGSGYTKSPMVTISGGGGSGAAAAASSDAALTFSLNANINWISPVFYHNTPPGTSFGTDVYCTSTSYGYRPPEPMQLGSTLRFEDTRMSASRINEINMLSGESSFKVELTFVSDNPNVSPTIDYRKRLSALTYANSINNQARDEDVLNSTASSSPVATIVLTSGGSGYVSAPTVTIRPAPNERNVNNIVPATATASVVSGVVTATNITNPGSGYTRPPEIVIAPPASGITAIANATINPINSELRTRGNAYSRYITRKIRLSTPSTGIRLLVDASSTPRTTFDWYIRTSLSGTSNVHEDSEWKILSCDVERDRSTDNDQFFEYEFYLDDIDEFDTYDLKMVPSSNDPAYIPTIKRYRAIVTV